MHLLPAAPGATGGGTLGYLSLLSPAITATLRIVALLTAATKLGRSWLTGVVQAIIGPLLDAVRPDIAEMRGNVSDFTASRAEGTPATIDGIQHLHEKDTQLAKEIALRVLKALGHEGADRADG
ncbi:MAG: hypothetical protein ACYDH5_18845 [Acidimicrobiales bacterium]